MESRNLPDLPPEIIYDHILTNVPVKSLLRFRSACKRWLDQIQDKAFVKVHHKRSKEKPKLLCETIPLTPTQRPKFFLLDCNSRQPFATTPLDSFPPSPSRIHSSSFGVVVLQACSPPYRIRVHNLATRQSLALPCPADSCSFHSTSHIVHDPSLTAFKLLHMFYEEGKIAYEILTIGIDQSWRKAPADDILGVTMLPSADLRQPTAAGAIHWTNMRHRYGRGFNEEDILAFDIKEEKFRVMPYPQSCPGGCFCMNAHRVNIDEVGGFLNLLHLDICFTCLDVWVLKNYRDQVWMKERRVSVSFIPRELRDGFVQMLRMGEAGEEILMVLRSNADCLLGSYNLSTGTFRDFKKEGPELENFTYTILVYEESLFGLGGNIFY